MKQICTKTLFTVFLILVCTILKAQTWTGAVNSAWNNAGNWTPASIPAYNTDVTIPGTGITNWPALTGDILVRSLFINPNAIIDTKGFKITVDTYNMEETFTVNGATIKNTAAGTNISIVSSVNSSITNTTFQGNTIIEFSGSYQNAFNYSQFIEGSNHYTGTAKFIESGSGPFYISQQKSTFDNDVEIEKASLGSSANPSFQRSSSVFLGGGTINGNLKYTNILGAYAYIGSAETALTVTGNVDITQNGSLKLSDKISYNGAGQLKLVGSTDTFLFYPGSNPCPLNIIIQKTGTKNVTLETMLPISGSLTLTNGNIVSSDEFPISFTDGATTTGASDASHILGPVHKIGNDAFTFPTGSNSKLFSVSISAPGSVSDHFSAEYFSSNPSGSGYNTGSKVSALTSVSTGGYWDVKKVAGSSGVFVTLGYSAIPGNVTDQSALRVAHWDGTKWQDFGNGGTTGSLTLGTVKTAAAVSTFSPFALASSDNSNPLPVKLIEFAAQKENETALLQWRTAEEANSDRFEIERSQNGLNWLKIGEVKASGNTQEPTRYDFSDKLPLQGINYYRLKMIDRDATYAYSSIENINLSSGSTIVLYPNPVSERLYIQTTKGNKTLKVELYNSLGNKVSATSGQKVDNGIDLTNLSSGNYVVNVTLSSGQIEKQTITVSR